MAKRFDMIYFLLPAYNEANNLKVLLPKIKSHMKTIEKRYKIFVVNDGSTDDTKIVIKNLSSEIPVSIINHEKNLGPGKAFDTGLSKILKYGTNSDVVITLEADNTSDLNILNKMLEKIEADNDLVLASIYAKEGKIENTSFYRKFLSYLANMILKTFFKISNVSTYSSFYRAYKVAVLKRAYEIYGGRLIEENGFACAAEILVKLNKIGIKMAEVPTVLDTSLRKGRSNMKMVRTVKDYIRMIVKNLFI